LLADVTVGAKVETMDQCWVESWVEQKVLLKVGRLVASMDDTTVQRLDIEMVAMSVGRKACLGVAASDDMMGLRWAYK